MGDRHHTIFPLDYLFLKNLYLSNILSPKLCDRFDIVTTTLFACLELLKYYTSAESAACVINEMYFTITISIYKKFSVWRNRMRALQLYITTCLALLFLNGEVNAQQMGWKASGKGGAVAAGGEKAVEAGISMLEQGGNAADAAVATLIALSITDYGSFAIGAEAAFIIYDAKKGEVKTLSGIGCAPLDPKAIEWYYQNGIPDEGGNLKAAPVPGAMSMFFKALQVYGTMSFEKVVAPSLALLDAGGMDWYPNLAKTLRKLVETEQKTPGTREEKLQAARDRFYKGDIADVLEAFYIENEGFLRKADLAAYQTLIEDPVKVNYRGYTVCKCST
jgi:gamma-glutamyltranspeptidase/glutathione hydrolase